MCLRYWFILLVLAHAVRGARNTSLPDLKHAHDSWELAFTEINNLLNKRKYTVDVCTLEKLFNEHFRCTDTELYKIH